MSKRYTGLRREFGVLRRQFLPDPFNPLGVYPDSNRVQAHARAFLVLSHAEIESFLEEWAKEITRAAELAWNKSNRVTAPLTYLLSSLGDELTLPNTLSEAGGKDCHARFSDIVKNLFPSFYKRIKENHGIKEKNLLALFEPIGISSAAFSPTLLPNLDALGTIRGKHAHVSAKAVLSVLDPETEFKRIENLAQDLLVLDQWLVAYKRRIR